MDQKESLNLRAKRLEIISKIDESRAKRIEFQQQSQKRVVEIESLSATFKGTQLENERKAFELKKQKENNTRVFDLCIAISMYTIDNEKTNLSDPVLKSIWSEEELKLLKDKLVKLL